ncbi:VWA domain-containing protein [Aquimarina sp. ERC-38]|uniref:VWA domain-containing protein n=1 Tax=Aquimarina sp. ERC-38 TaxID=2949996 RepID=UPI002246A73F|nr:VWA domain-containing protein [Aquimarina sp. ERC-38]UZO80305.1 VWA domain-containing protein [Aquimarina sp. ERC-38]
MQSETVVLIVGAICVALSITWFQYFFKQKEKINWILASLRFLSILIVLILLINPSLTKRSFESIKPILTVAVDNSASIAYLEEDKNTSQFISELKANEDLNKKFDLNLISFSNHLLDSLHLSFKDKQTNIEKSLNEIDQIYKGTLAPIVLVSDGNQTVGKDYTYKGTLYKQQIFPIVIGDTAQTKDSKIEWLNVNRYAFLKNKFPVEVLVSSNVQKDSEFKVYQKGKVVYRQKLSFSSEVTSKIINFTLPASRSGIQKYRAVLEPDPDERNTVNNQKNFAVEVIEQKTQALIISNIIHPDIGAFKKSIESQENRSVVIKKPGEVTNFEDFQLILLYQPDASFKSIMTSLQTAKKNYLIVSGESTDWRFLNGAQKLISQELTGQTEYYQPKINTLYNSFLVSPNIFNEYPPLVGAFGEVRLLTTSDILMYRTINSIETEDPLLVTFETEGQRHGFLLGEGFWKWRSYAYTQNKSFESVDLFIAKIVQYLSSTKKRSRLNVFSESFYYSNAGVVIKAEYFTKNYEFDKRARLTITISNKDKSFVKSVPLLLKDSTYEVELSDLPPGDYKYTVSVKGEEIAVSDSFSVLEFDVEKQSLSANLASLRQLATDTEGKLYTIDQKDSLVRDLLSDKRYQTVQRSKVTQISIIDWKILLALLLLLLATEWFVRKYKGLI